MPGYHFLCTVCVRLSNSEELCKPGCFAYFQTVDLMMTFMKYLLVERVLPKS